MSSAETGRARTDVAIIIPTLKRTARLDSCVASVLASGSGRDVQVVCVVNSGDGASPAVTEGSVTYVSTGVNLGWSGGLMFGAALVNASHYWLVQDDMTVDPHCLTALLEALERDRTLGAARPMILDERGRIRRRSGGVYLSAEGYPVRGWPMRDIGVEVAVVPDDLTFIAGSGMLVRREAWDDAGGWDPDYYPVQYADADFCARLRDTGWAFRLIRGAHAAHSGSGSTPSHLRFLLAHHNGARFRSRWVTEGSTTAGASPSPAVPSVHPAITRERLGALVGLSNAAMFGLDDWLSTQRVRRPLGQRWRGAYWTLRAHLSRRY